MEALFYAGLIDGSGHLLKGAEVVKPRGIAWKVLNV